MVFVNDEKKNKKFVIYSAVFDKGHKEKLGRFKIPETIVSERDNFENCVQGEKVRALFHSFRVPRQRGEAFTAERAVMNLRPF